MKISSISGNTAAQQPVQAEGKVKEAAVQPADNRQKDTPPAEYIPSDSEDRKPSGLYRYTQDENGNPQILYDDPRKPEAGEKSGSRALPDYSSDQNRGSARGIGGDKPDEEECTMNTDRVDQEIQALKTKKQQLQQQIRAAEDEEKAKALESRLAQVEGELSQKDNDAYRKQNAVVS